MNVFPVGIVHGIEHHDHQEYQRRGYPLPFLHRVGILWTFALDHSHGDHTLSVHQIGMFRGIVLSHAFFVSDDHVAVGSILVQITSSRTDKVGRVLQCIGSYLPRRFTGVEQSSETSNNENPKHDLTIIVR